MNKINKIIAMASLPLLSLMTACTTTNEWEYDTTINRQSALSSLEATADSTTISIDVKFETQKSASGYEVQISTQKLTEGFDNTASLSEADGKIYTYRIMDNTVSSITINRDSVDKHGEKLPYVMPEMKENTKYYLRVRSLSATKDASKWYTDGVMGSTYSVSTPAVLYSTNLDVDIDNITVRWITGLKYAKPAVIVYAGEYEDAYDTGTGHEYTLTDADKETGMATISENIESGFKYRFDLKDENGNIIGTTYQSTEVKPNMDIAYSIFNFADFTKQTVGSVQTYSDGYFKATFTDVGGKFKCDARKTCDFFDPLKNRFKTEEIESADGGYRVNTGGKAGTIDFEIPSAGRLYIYAYTGAAGRYVTLKNSSKEKIINEEVPSTKIERTIIKEDGEVGTVTGYAFTKATIPAAGTYQLTWDASIYICGFQFVPDEE